MARLTSALWFRLLSVAADGGSKAVFDKAVQKRTGGADG